MITEPECGHCLRRQELVERDGDGPLELDATGTLACFGCFVPDITQPAYQQPIETYIVDPPESAGMIGEDRPLP